MDLGLQDRVALVTGSSQGIGRSVAELMSKEGARVAITYRQHEQQATDLADAISAQGGQATVISYDLDSADSIRRSVEHVISKWGRLDILVNNAIEFGARSIADSPLLENWPEEEWRMLLRCNLEGAFLTTQCVVPHMRRQKWGRIVNVSSTVATDGQPGSAWYGMAKAGLNGFTSSLYKELGPFGILVNSVLPAPTRTQRVSGVRPEILQHLAKQTALNRLLDPSDVANTIVFLCSAINTGITGAVIRIGGGS